MQVLAWLVLYTREEKDRKVYHDLFVVAREENPRFFKINTWMMKKLLFPILPLWLLKICFYPWPTLAPFILVLTLSYFLFTPCRDLAVILTVVPPGKRGWEESPFYHATSNKPILKYQSSRHDKNYHIHASKCLKWRGTGFKSCFHVSLLNLLSPV